MRGELNPSILEGIAQCGLVVLFYCSFNVYDQYGVIKVFH
jgi:hypothetical protein